MRHYTLMLVCVCVCVGGARIHLRSQTIGSSVGPVNNAITIAHICVCVYLCVEYICALEPPTWAELCAHRIASPSLNVYKSLWSRQIKTINIPGTHTDFRTERLQRNPPQERLQYRCVYIVYMLYLMHTICMAYTCINHRTHSHI